MSQKITIGCIECDSVEEHECERSIVMLWTEKGLGIITHGIEDEDWHLAVRELAREASKTNAAKWRN